MNEISSRSTVGETADVANNVCSAIEKSAISDTFLTNESALLKQHAGTMIKGIGTNKGKDLTDALYEADDLRDNLLSALIHLLKGFELWDKEPIAAAATLIMKIVDNHGGNFSRLSSEKESATYDSMLKKFDEPEAVAAFATMGITALVTDMKSAEASFKELYQQSAEIESGKTTVAPSSIKRNTLGKLNDIIRYLDSMSRANATVYGALAANVAELVDNVNAKVRIRMASGKKEAVQTL